MAVGVAVVVPVGVVMAVPVGVAMLLVGVGSSLHDTRRACFCVKKFVIFNFSSQKPPFYKRVVQITL